MGVAYLFLTARTAGLLSPDAVAFILTVIALLVGLVFLMLPGNDVFLELCHSPDYPASCPEDLMHTALGVPDIIAYCGQLESAGIEIWPAAWREKFAAGGRKMAFVTDPDGYEVEILEI